MEPSVSEDQPVHGDLDTVNALGEEHDALERERGQRHRQLETVRRAAQDVLARGRARSGSTASDSAGDGKFLIVCHSHLCEIKCNISIWLIQVVAKAGLVSVNLR